MICIQIIVFAKHLFRSKGLRGLWLLGIFLLLGALRVLAQAGHGTVQEIRPIYPSEWGVPYPAGLAYATDRAHLFLLDKGSTEPSRTGSTVVIITPYEDLVSSVQLEFMVDDAINMAFDDGSNRLFLLNDARAELAQVAIDENGLLDPATLVRLPIASLGLIDAQGMAIDAAKRRLFILDRGTTQVLSIALEDFAVSHIELAQVGNTELRGLAVHPTTHHLYVGGPGAGQLYEVTTAGQWVASYDLTSLNLVDMGGLLFAPSADLTDPADTFHLFIADSGLTNHTLVTASFIEAAHLYLPLIVQPDGNRGSASNVVIAAQDEAQLYGQIIEAALICEGCPLTQSIAVSITHSTDDAEERLLSGRVITDSTDLELIQETTTQTVGLRFPGITIPADALIVSAFIEFTVDELNSEPTTLLFQGEATDDAPPFAATKGNISSRTPITAGVTWLDISAWNVVHEKHQTPDLSPIVQVIVDRTGWSSGNAMAFIITGTGKRTAKAYDGDPARAPQLIVEYIEPTPTPTLTLTPTLTPTGIETPVFTPTATPTPPPPDATIRFAVIGDYGNNNPDEARVATLVRGWNPDFVITTGDNNYPDGEATTIDDNIGQYYGQFIGSYQGAYGTGSPANRFWPSLGNHDWHTITCTGNSCDGAYFDYFNLPNNERYYEIDLGLVHLFALDSESTEPDGRKQNSIQAEWLLNQLDTSTSCYNIVYFHHAPYSSGRHGSNAAMQWPFARWGADAVLAGHEHLYERLDVSGTPYFVNGAGGRVLYNFDNVGNLPPEASSIVRYNQDYGAMLVTATSIDITYQFYSADGVLIDDYTMRKDCQ